ncbi:15120_t:CDS:1, partial [Entrophospora sp. SA101]
RASSAITKFAQITHYTQVKIKNTMHFSQKNTAATKKSSEIIIFTLAVFFIIFFSHVEQVSAHGRMIQPPIRIKAGDENQGFTITNGPTKEEPCAGNLAGPVKSKFKSGETIPIQWKITAAHRGTCTVQLSVTGQDTDFKDLKKFDNCADATGDFSDTVALPKGVSCDKCTLRWKWDAELTKELYLNCADISIGKGSSNKVKRNDVPKIHNKKRVVKSSASRRLAKRKF